MRRDRRSVSMRQRGFSIAAAIFLILVMAIMAAGMVQIFTVSHQSLSQEFTSAKAYLAGRSGLQWAMYQAVYAGATGNQTLTFSNGGLNGTEVAVSLNRSTIDGEIFYTIDASGAYGAAADPEYSLRSMRLRFKP